MALLSFLLSLTFSFLWFFFVTVPSFSVGLFGGAVRSFWEMLWEFFLGHAGFFRDLLSRSARLVLSLVTRGAALIISLFVASVELARAVLSFPVWICRAIFDLLLRSAGLSLSLLTRGAACIRSLFVASYELVFSCARALLSGILDRLSSIFGFASLVLDPHEAVRRTRNAFTSPFCELSEWRSIASSPESARDLIKHLMKVIDADRITILSLADDKAAAESAWQAATSDLQQAFERVEELEDEARAAVAFMHERCVQTGESSASHDELHGMRDVVAGDRLTILSLLDDKAALESAWEATTQDLQMALERVDELEVDLTRYAGLVEEARAIVRFFRERPPVRGESSAARSPQSCVRRAALERKMGLGCVLD